MIVILLVSIWVNISEVFRYFLLVRPEMQSFLDQQEGIAQMSWSILAIWGLWDMLLTALIVAIFWLCATVFDNSWRTIFTSGTLTWLAIFVMFWVATANSGLADWRMLWVVLPLSWLEMIVAAFISSRLYSKTIKS